MELARQEEQKEVDDAREEENRAASNRKEGEELRES